MPSYLKELVTLEPLNNLRSGSDLPKLKAVISRSRKEDQLFAYAAPKIFNSLPLKLRKLENTMTFKQQLKTHLFKEAYPEAVDN